MAYDDRTVVPANDRLRIFIAGGGGVGNRPFDALSADSFLTGTALHILVARWDGGTGNLTARVEGVQVINVARAVAPTGGAAFAALNIGSASGSTSYLPTWAIASDSPV